MNKPQQQPTPTQRLAPEGWSKALKQATTREELEQLLKIAPGGNPAPAGLPDGQGEPAGAMGKLVTLPGEYAQIF